MTRRRAISLGAQGAAFLAGVAFLIVLPHWLSDFRASQVAYVGVYFIAIMGLNILTGYTGQISLGHGAFMAIGGYTTAIMVGHHNVRDLWTIPVAGLIAGAAGLLFGVPALRLSGLYLALATFAIAVALPAVLKKFDHFTGGTEGINLFGVKGVTDAFGTKGPNGQCIQCISVLGHKLTFNDWLYYLCWGIAALLFVIAWVVLGGRMGRTFRAIRDSEIAATSSGINMPLYKTLAFGLSAFYAGIAGSLFALATTFVNPDTFPIVLSLYLLIGAVISGLGSLWGIAAGALFIQYVPDLASKYVSKAPGAPSVAYAVVLIVVVLLLPFGLTGLIRKTTRPLTDRLFRGS
jgi:branched-chain amino acid transport system permease protein